MNSGIETKVFKTVDYIGKEEIDSIVDDGFFTYGWLKTLEVSKPPIDLDPFYVAAYHKGNLTAFTPCFRDIVDQYFQYGPDVIPLMKRTLNVYHRLRLGQNHVLLCYSPWCFRTRVFIAKNRNNTFLIRCLAQEIDAICKKQKILFSSFLFVSEFDTHLIRNLETLGYYKFLFGTPTLYLDVRWQSFEDYLLSLGHDVRHYVRREMRRTKDNGVTIEEVTEFKDLSKTLSDLSFNYFLKYNKWAQRLEPRFFESLSDYAKANTVVFLAKKKDIPVGFSLCQRQGETLDVFLCGFNYELQEKNDYTYFSLIFYAPISWAIQKGVRKIFYRWAAEEAKYRRGCKSEKIYSFVKCHNRFLNSQIGNYLRIKNRIKKPN